MKKLKLTRGKYALVDNEDYDLASQYRWSTEFSRNTYYGKCSNVMVNGKRRTLRLHQFIMGHFDKPDERVDHRNGKGWDCRKENLRVVTESQNSANRAKLKGCSSKYKGVVWVKSRKKWRAQINHKHIGYYITERAAAMNYDLSALNEYGGNARLNFPDEWRMELEALRKQEEWVSARDRGCDSSINSDFVPVEAVLWPSKGGRVARRKVTGGPR